MKDKARSVRVKGTVLYTVISVLMILIVFLMGTLALAATASNRAYTNYQKEQTEYTARAVLDSVVEAINRDTTSSGIKSQMVSRLQNRGNSFDVDVQIDGEMHVVTITNTGTQNIYSKDKEQWVTGDIYELSTTVDKLLAGTTYSAYIIGEHQITSVPSGGGGAFVSLGDTGGTEIGTGGYITGGTYIGVGIPQQGYTVGANGGTTIDSPFYVNGNLTNVNAFYMHYRQTGDFFAIMGDLIVQNNAGIFPIYDGFVTNDNTYEKLPYIYVGGNFYIDHATVIGTPDLDGDGDETDGVPTNIYCGSIQGGSPSAPGSVAYDLSIYGDVYTFDPTQTSKVGGSGGSTALYEWAGRTLMKRDGSNAVVGNWYSAGSLEFNAHRGGNFVQGDVRVDKNFTVNGSDTLLITGDLIVGGTATINGKLNCTGNIIADTLVVNGNVISKDITVNHLLGGGTIDSTGTVKYGDKVMSKYATEKIVWYTDLVTTEDQIVADWGLTNEFRSTYTVNVHTKTIYSDATFTEEITTKYETFTGWGSPVDIAAITAPYAINNSEAITTERQTFGAPADTLTVNGIEQAGIALQTTETRYGQKVYPEDFTNANITLNILDLPVLTDYTSYPTTPAELGASIHDGSAYVVPTYTRAAAPTNTGSGTEYYEITQSCVLTGMFDKNIYINPGAGNPITVIFQDVTMPEGAGGGYGGTSIIVNDESQVTLFVDGSLSIGKGCILTADYMDLIYGAAGWDMTKNSITDSIGSGMISDLTIHQNQTATSPYYPNVVIYGNEGSILDLSGNNSLVTALVRAPKMTYKQSIGIGLGKDVHYVNPSGGEIIYGPSNPNGNNKNMGIIGQLVAEHIVLTNDAKWGLVYVTAGNPTLTCSCGCASCTVTSPSTCSCNCGTAGCICSGSSGPRVPSTFVNLYYNYY